MDINEQKTCALCGRKFSSFLDKNNGWPITDKYVCGECNMDKVIPARLAKMYNKPKGKE